MSEGQVGGGVPLSEGQGGVPLSAVHSFNASRHRYEFLLHLANVTESDLHRYDLQVSNELGTTVGSVHVVQGEFLICQSHGGPHLALASTCCNFTASLILFKFYLTRCSRRRQTSPRCRHMAILNKQRCSTSDWWHHLAN